MESHGSEGQRLELDMADLEGANLAGYDLSGALIRRSNLDGANLRDAVLVMADLAYCSMAGADLSGADLSGCALRRVNLSGASLKDAVLKSVPIVGDPERPWPTNLQSARLVNADVRCRVAEGVLLGYSDLIGAQLNLALLKGADLTGARYVRPAAEASE
jgi:uncharacterized protein YjbI with pentapeptide repeats